MALNVSTAQRVRLKCAVGILSALWVCACANAQGTTQHTSGSQPSVLPSGFSERTITLATANIHFVSGGKGPAVVLLHGFPEDWSAWRKMAPSLAKRFTVIAPDLPGIGGSSNKSDKFDATSMAESLAVLLEELKVRNAYLVGHDIGGPVAYALARLQPQRVRGVMLVESPLEGMPTWTAARNSPLMWHLGFHQTPDLPEQLLAGRETIYVRHFLKLSAGGVAPNEADVARYASAYRAPDRLAALLAIYRQLPSQEAFNLAHRERTTIPIVFVGGERVFGQLTDGIVKDLRSWGWTNVTGHVVTGAGHYIADEQPDALSALITQHATSR